MRNSIRVSISLLITLLFVSDGYSQIFTETELQIPGPFGLIMAQNIGTNGVSVADYNNDGTPDLYFVVRDSTWGGDQRTWNRLFLNDSGTLVDKSLASGLTGISQTRWSEMGYNIGASWGDYNNDDLPDIFIYYTGKDELFKNNGDGTFTNVSSTAGIAGSETQFTSHGLWWDYDKDGDLDLYVTVRKDVALENQDSKNRMYENIGDDIFLNVSDSSGLADHRLSYMSVAFDVDNDSDLDLYIANDFGENSLYLNNGDKTFTRDSENSAGLNDHGEGMGIAIGDVDANGYFDIYVTNVTESGLDTVQKNPLLLNNGNGTFTNRADEANVQYSGWGWGTTFFDFDNDTDLDLFVSTGYFSDDNYNRLFENDSPGIEVQFKDISSEAGVEDYEVSRANVVMDYNSDGFLDLLISNFYTQPKLYLNTSNEGNWITVNLEGVQTNRSAFGTIVEISVNGKKYRRLHHGAQFFGQSILPINFGLGEALSVDTLTVHWLNGRIEIFQNVTANQQITLREGEGIITGIEDQLTRLTPAEFEILGNYPNPFNGSTTIQFVVNKSGSVKLEVFDTVGRMVFSTSTLIAKSGTHQISWNPGLLHSGIYLYRLTKNEGLSRTGTMLFLK